MNHYRYCNQVLNKDIDSCCTRLLQDLVRFQDRMYHKDPVKVRGSQYTHMPYSTHMYHKDPLKMGGGSSKCLIKTHAIHNSCITVTIHHKDPVKVRGSKYTCTTMCIHRKDLVKKRGSK